MNHVKIIGDKKLTHRANKIVVREIYSPLVRKTIAMYLERCIQEILDTMTITSQKLSAEDIKKYENQIIAQVLKTEKCKQILLFELDRLSLKKEDMMADLLKQYGVDKRSYSTDYHDETSIIFSETLTLFQMYVKTSAYDLIVRELQD